jgi:hypothetical protein
MTIFPPFSGDLVDKNLVRALKKDDKRKAEGKEVEKKDKKKKAARPPMGQRPQGMYNPYGWQGGYPVGPQQHYPMYQPQGGHYPMATGMAYGPRTETRICSNCNKQGHLMRNCPLRQPPAAAMGVAPK